MNRRLIVLTGTGTEIGKTHLGEALLRAWVADGIRSVGLKPVESGVTGNCESDTERLGGASSFHVKHSPPYVFREPISPHLAARRAGVSIAPDTIARWVSFARQDAGIALVELPGGLFSPLGDGLLNAHLAARLAPDAVLLAAPDRLGVLHDVVCATRAAQALPLRIDAIALIAPAGTDASTGTNAAELSGLVAPPVLATVARDPPDVLARSAAVQVIARRLQA